MTTSPCNILIAIAIAIAFALSSLINTASADIPIDLSYCVCRTGFTDRCRDIHIRLDTATIQATCRSKSGNETLSTLDLDRFIDNNNGALVSKSCNKLKFIRKDCNFTNWCRSLHLVFNTDLTTTLFARCETDLKDQADPDGTIKSEIKLDDIIGVNKKGQLQWNCGLYPIHFTAETAETQS